MWSSLAGKYYMPDSDGIETQVDGLEVMMFRGNYMNTNTPDPEVLEDAEITVNGTVAAVVVPIASLGDTGGSSEATRGLALKGTRSDGQGSLMTKPVNFTLRAAGSGGGEPGTNSLFNDNPALFEALLTALGLPADTALLNNSSIVVGAVLSFADAQAALASLSSDIPMLKQLSGYRR